MKFFFTLLWKSYHRKMPKDRRTRIWEALKKLETFPQSHQERTEGRYAGKGYRQLLIDNYIAIFKIDESKKTVHVVTVQYQGRNV